MAGKLFHIDRNGRGLPGHPFCPADNDLTHNCTKMWGKGLRQPFRFTMRPNGGLVLGDVGWREREEINLDLGRRPQLRLALLRGHPAHADL